MKVISATFSTPSNTSVIIQTLKAGAVAIQLAPLPDVSGGWQAEYVRYALHGGYTAPYIAPIQVETLEEFVARNGYSVFALLDLSDIEGKLALTGIEKPPKSAAVRAWIDETRLAFASNQPAQPAPFTYQDVKAEVLAVLAQSQF